MNTFIVYTFSSYSYPKIQAKEIQGSDVLQALQNTANLNYADILSIKLKGVTDAVVGI